MITIVTTGLPALYEDLVSVNGQTSASASAGQAGNRALNAKIDHYAHLFPEQAYRWLVDQDPIVQQLVEDVIDTLQALRAADSLRHVRHRLRPLWKASCSVWTRKISTHCWTAIRLLPVA